MCSYCEYVGADDFQIQAELEVLTCGDVDWYAIPVNFCPVCGRKLQEPESKEKQEMEAGE